LSEWQGAMVVGVVPLPVDAEVGFKNGPMKQFLMSLHVVRNCGFFEI
jgi:hypothetical protein